MRSGPYLLPRASGGTRPPPPSPAASPCLSPVAARPRGSDRGAGATRRHRRCPGAPAQPPLRPLWLSGLKTPLPRPLSPPQPSLPLTLRCRCRSPPPSQRRRWSRAPRSSHWPRPAHVALTQGTGCERAGVAAIVTPFGRRLGRCGGRGGTTSLHRSAPRPEGEGQGRAPSAGLLAAGRAERLVPLRAPTTGNNGLAGCQRTGGGAVREEGGDGRTRAVRRRCRALLGLGRWNFLEVVAAARLQRTRSRGRDGSRPRGTGTIPHPPTPPPPPPRPLHLWRPLPPPGGVFRRRWRSEF